MRSSIRGAERVDAGRSHSRWKGLLVRPDGWTTALLIASLALGGMAPLLARWQPTDAQALVAAAGVVISGAAVTASRVRRTQGWFDLFHPLLFPSVYAGVAFLVPTWVLLVLHRPVGILGTPLATNTAFLLAAAAASFTLGCATSALFSPKHSAPSPQHGPRASRISPKRVRYAAWAILVIPIAVALWDLHNGVIFSRGLNQTNFDLTDHIGALAGIAGPTSVALLMAGHRLAGHRQLLSPLDWFAVGTLLVALGLNGRRSAALAVLLVVLHQWPQRRKRGLPIILGMLTVACLAYVVVSYRGALTGEQDYGFFYATVRDLTPALFTTGATAAVIPSVTPHLYGSTYLAGLLRQVPGPIATLVLGPPDDTGSFVFRRIIGYDNPDQGFGFSVPAEGYLNFGVAGLIAACLVFGAAFAWSYRQRGDGSRPIHLLYPLLIGAFPFGLRSDFLGLVKSVAFPMLIVSLVYLVARTKPVGAEDVPRRPAALPVGGPSAATMTPLAAIGHGSTATSSGSSAMRPAATRRLNG